MSGSRRRWLLLALALAPVAGLGAAPARAEESSPAPPSAAAWYPSGVGTLTAPTQPGGSLHVGAALGEETDRTYLRFDVAGIPDDAEIDGVTITIPLDPAAGTSAAESAVVLACAVPAGFEPSDTEPAEVDCDGAPEATVDATSLTVELPGAAITDTVDVALVPGGGDTWHLGFDGPDGDAPPTAVATFTAPPAATTTTSTRPAPSAPAARPSVNAPVALAPPLVTPPPAAVGRTVADQAAISSPAAVAAAPASIATDGGFRYAAVFALPLVLLVLVGLIGDGLTRPVRLREETA